MLYSMIKTGKTLLTMVLNFCESRAGKSILEQRMRYLFLQEQGRDGFIAKTYLVSDYNLMMSLNIFC